MIPALVLAGASLLAAPAAGPVDNDSDDMTFVEIATSTPEFYDLCAVLPNMAYDLYLSPLFASDEMYLAEQMLVSWVVEETEIEIGHNLSEAAEVYFAGVLGDCAAYGTAAI